MELIVRDNLVAYVQKELHFRKATWVCTKKELHDKFVNLLGEMDKITG